MELGTCHVAHSDVLKAEGESVHYVAVWRSVTRAVCAHWQSKPRCIRTAAGMPEMGVDAAIHGGAAGAGSAECQPTRTSKTHEHTYQTVGSADWSSCPPLSCSTWIRLRWRAQHVTGRSDALVPRGACPARTVHFTAGQIVRSE